MVLLVTEMRDLMPKNDFKRIPFKPLDKKINPWTMERAEREGLPVDELVMEVAANG
jgi:hypothetical protein